MTPEEKDKLTILQFTVEALTQLLAPEQRAALDEKINLYTTRERSKCLVCQVIIDDGRRICDDCYEKRYGEDPPSWE